MPSLRRRKIRSHIWRKGGITIVRATSRANHNINGHASSSFTLMTSNLSLLRNIRFLPIMYHDWTLTEPHAASWDNINLGLSPESDNLSINPTRMASRHQHPKRSCQTHELNAGVILDSGLHQHRRLSTAPLIFALSHGILKDQAFRADSVEASAILPPVPRTTFASRRRRL